MKALMGTIALLAALAPALGYAAKEQITIFTFDDATCAAWSKTASNKELRAEYYFWVRGFVSGYNYGNPTHQVKTAPGSNDLYQYLDRYCRDNPKLLFVGGVLELVEQFRKASVPAKKEAAKAAPKSKAAPKEAK